MDVLKSVGYILSSILVLSVIIGGGILITLFTTIVGIVFSGVGVVIFVAICLKEYFERKK